MRIIAILLIISVSGLANGQNIRLNFSDTVLYENFQTNNYTFPQKYNAVELFIVENGQYRLKRIKKESNSVAFAKTEELLGQFELQASFSLVKTKNKKRSAGVVLHSQPDGNGAILVEVNSSGKFKVTKIVDNQLRYLSGTPKERGWVKTKAIYKKGQNDLIIKVAKGYYDIYFNDKHVYTAYDAQFKNGRAGLLVGPDSEMLVYEVLIKKEAEGLEIPASTGGGTVSAGGSNINDPSFKEVISLFKVKIDEQDQKIKTLQRELDRCRSTLNYDTAMISEFKTTANNNKILTRKLDSTSNALNAASRRLEYLESFKKNVEEGSNGDLVLNLATIVAELKDENKLLNAKVTTLSASNETLKKDNDVLLREVDRLRYLLGLKE